MPPHFGRLSGGKPSGAAVPIIVCVGASLLMSSSSLGQTVSPREFAASQPTELDPEADSAGQPLWETAIATTSRRAIAVYQNECIIDESEQKRIGFAVYDRQDSEWIGSGLISGGLIPATTDPSIAVDSVSGDFNVYARLLTYNSGEGYWELGDEVQVNDDDTLYESDQFLPSPTVDSSGRLHITWYDDRLYNASSDQADGTATADPKFDVFYARGVVNGQGLLTFPTGNQLLYGTGDEEDEPELNYALLHDPDPDWDFPDRPGEYNGIAVDGSTVWTTFTGTSAQDDNQVNNPSVIWSSLIVWTP